MRSAKTDARDLIRDLEEALAINEDSLEEALQAQPDAFYRVAKALALESSRRDALKQYVEEAEAAAYLELKQEARDDEIKLSEAELKAKVRIDPDVIAAIDKLLTKSRLVAALQALEKSFSQRSYALKDLVELHLKNYYSDATSGRSDVRERQRQAVHAKQTRMRETFRRRDH